ncbi:MAG: hypothetical protein PCFJNLEI_03233 [Verrucomicrobiae bacterium]|nr:hypothetical protein [Verrucomicrobiae bacterium]
MNNEGPDSVVRQRHEQMLKLVAKGFYNELINYGVNRAEILTVTNHLLDNMLQQTNATPKSADYYNRLFRLTDIRDDWAAHQRLAIHEVHLAPLTPPLLPLLAGWLAVPPVRDSFVAPFPATVTELAEYFQHPTRDYLGIYFQGEPVGIIGAENLDPTAGKCEMRKLVGTASLRGKGIGKQATLLFLYYVFEKRQLTKIYLHSTDTNIRNLNLNSKFGFELEGLFFEDIVTAGQRRDVVRMGLRAAVWRKLFA